MTNYSELAQRIAETSANVGAGDVVVIDGGTHTIPLMEAIAMEAQKAGGMVTMLLNSDQVIRSLFTDVPIKYLEKQPTYLAEWLKQIDVWIGLPDIENPRETLGDVPEDRFAKAAEASQAITDMLNESGVRAVIIGYPNEEMATMNQMDFANFEEMHWAAVNADYAAISEKGKAIQAMLKGAKKARVTLAHRHRPHGRSSSPQARNRRKVRSSYPRIAAGSSR